MKWSKRKKASGTKRGQFRSLLEKRIHQRVKKRVAKNVAIGIESHDIPYTLVKNYIPDLVLCFPDGRTRYIEVKGWFKPEDRTKMKAVKMCNPALDIRMVFAANNKLHSSSSTRYSDWCERYSIPWAIGDVPKEWLK